MSFSYSGKVFWANGSPVASAQVRLYDPPNDQGLGPDLTIQPGLSGADGTFTIQAQDSHFVDNVLLEGLNTLSSLFDRLDIHGLSLGNDTRPSFQFTYSVNGSTRQAALPFRKLHRAYYLPLNPPVDFIPSRDAFGFENLFLPFDLPITFPSWLGINKTAGGYGLCGGMSSAAYDYRLAKLSGNQNPPNIRQYTSVPQTGTPLQLYLLRRSLDTFGLFGEMLVKVGDWTMLPNDGPMGVQKLSLDELPKIQLALDNGQCLVLTLIYEHANDLNDLANKIWDNHQVLAYKTENFTADQGQICIYDSNYPDNDGVRLQVNRVQVGNNNGVAVYGLQITEFIPGDSNLGVRGFFPMAYQPASPP